MILLKKVSILPGIIIIVVAAIILFGAAFCFQYLGTQQLDKLQIAIVPPPNPTAGWQTYTDSANGFEFKYPVTFSGSTWQAQTWPPSVTVVSGVSNAIPGCSTKGPISNETINNMNFIVYKNSDAGAGQLYSNYCYIFTGPDSRQYFIGFLIHSTNGCGNGNCGPWCGTPNEQACKNFDMQKEVVGPIEKIVSTFKFTK